MLSKIDYCNSIYQGAPTYAINKLQRLQNMGCRIIRKVDKYYHITPHLIELHWLRIRERIVYKVCVLMFKCINGLTPQYLLEIIIHAHGCNLRSSTFNHLPTVRCNTAIAHNSAFSPTGTMILRIVAASMCLKLSLKPSCLVHLMTYISSFNILFYPTNLFIQF